MMACWFFRCMISHAADSDGDLGPLTSRHTARCASCRQFHRSCRALGAGLRSEAAALGRASGPSAAPIPADPAPVPPQGRRRLTRAVFAAAACGVIAALAGMLVTWQREPPEPPIAPPPATWAGPYPALAWPGLIESPLETEVKKLTSHTESGIRFLVACLQVNPLAAAAPSEPQGPLPTP